MSLAPFDPQHIDARIGDGLASILGLKSARQSPPDIDLGAAGVQWDLGQAGFAGMIPFVGQLTGATINGVVSQSKELIAPNGIASVIVPASSFNCRVQGVYAYLLFDAAGAAAFNGKRVSAFWSLFSVSDNFQVDIGGVTDTVNASAQTAYRLYPTGWINPGWIVPDGYRLRVTMISLDNVVFPANTTWQLGVTGFKQALHGQLPR